MRWNPLPSHLLVIGVDIYAAIMNSKSNLSSIESFRFYSFFSSVVERGIAAMQAILRSLFRSREGAVLLPNLGLSQSQSFALQISRALLYDHGDNRIQINASLLALASGDSVLIIRFRRTKQDDFP
jgi:hypothetical protein